MTRTARVTKKAAVTHATVWDSWDKGSPQGWTVVLRIISGRSGCSWSGGVGDRDGEQRRDGDRQQPPQVDPVVGGDRHHGESDHDAEGEAPVVADDEVVPEPSEQSDAPHATALVNSVRSRRRRRN